ncbi:type II toxin-antitoxin system PemK/MazF family toxin [Microcoleus sp. D2_18a_B4]|uniref:type II toxin-antitoxin system PemK/MazF family toxin n=1 Tax=Microcoleus sp. D2_18a_B4 TaxID=3055329 RepID=UPI002FD3D29B
MPNYQSGEVLLLALPFADVTTSKLRTVLVLLDAGDEDIVVARVTSQTNRTVFDVEIVEWEQAGFLRSSVVRLHKVNTIEKRFINR